MTHDIHDGALGMLAAELRHSTKMTTGVIWGLMKSPPRARTIRTQRKAYTCDDFPGVNWEGTPNYIRKETGLSLPVIYRLKSDYEKKNQSQSRKA